MLSIKSGVRILGVQTEMLLAINIIYSVYEELSFNCQITSIMDGVHGVGSLHYSGNAVDFGVHTVPTSRLAEVVDLIKNNLGMDFDVLHEYVGQDREHIHVEYQPKNSY